MKDHDGLRKLLRRRGAPLRPLTVGVCVTLGVLIGPAAAGAASVTDVGEGFPYGINTSDQILIGKLTLEENLETHEIEENTEGPWSIWSGGKSTSLVPLNGAEKHEEPEIPHHELALSGINDAGLVAGSSTVGYTSEGKELTHFVPVWYDPEGTGHEVGLLQPTIKNKKGEAVPGAGIGTGIDNAGDVVGFDVVEEGEKLTGHGSFAAGGSSASAVGEADKPATSPWFSSVFRVNASGEMFGEVAEVDAEGANINPKYYFWKTAGEAGAKLNFDSFKNGFGLANDGSVLGGRAGKLYLRMPDGKETEVAGLSKPFSVNSAHQVVGSATIAGKEVAAVWQGGTVTDLNKLLPENSGWVLKRAAFVNDAGDITGVGTHEGHTHVFLLKSGIVVTSAKDEKESSKVGTGICATEKGGCTLRAAIETVNKAADSAPARVTFNIAGVPAGTIAKLSPESPLPPITKPVNIDATTQPEAFTAGSRTIGAIIDGTNAGNGNGLELAPGSAGSTVAGLQIQHFKGDGVKLADENQQLADSVLTDDTTGAEVAGNNDTVGAANGLAGDIFFTDGDAKGLAEYLASNGGKKQTVAEYQSALVTYGSGILLTSPSTGANITGDYIGVHGPGFSSAPDALGQDGFATTNLAGDQTVMPFGVVIAPTSGPISNVTVGGPGAAANVDSGTLFGLQAIAGESGAVNGLSIQGNSFGTATDGSALEPLGGLFGVTAAGAVNGLQIGASGAANKFQGLLVGTALLGEQVSSPSVQGNTYGTNANFGSLGKHFGLHDFFGLILADTQGAQIGGTSSGQGNSILGTAFGLLLSGQHAANDMIAGNTIGSTSPAIFTTFLKLEFSELYGAFGVLMTGSAKPGVSNASQNITFQSNTIQGVGFGLISTATTGMSLYGNTIQDDAFGVADLASGGAQIGAPGRGNAFLNDGFGLFMANSDPSPDELKQAEVNPKDSAPSTREGLLSEPNENLAFNSVNAITTANLSATSANTPSVPGTNNSILANNFGISSGGAAAPNELPVAIIGDEHGVQFGGTAPGQGNNVQANRDAGVWIAGNGSEVPTVQILGNTIYNNENFTGSLTGVPGLGIDLISSEGAVGEFGPIGIDPQDPTQPDLGANNLQNSPVLSSASISGATLTITGSLHGVASTNYLLEVFADENPNPFGAGEGQTLLGRISVPTDASGNVSFTSTFAAPGAGYRFVSSTATTVPASGPGVTSEFSVNTPITTAPAAATATTPSTTTSGTTTTPKSASTTTVSASGGSASTSGASVTLPAQVSCSSATSSTCTVTTTATVSATSASKASVTAGTAAAKHKHGKAPLTIGHGAMTLAPGASSPLHLTLTGQGLKLLRARHTLAITVTVTITGSGRPTITHTLHFQLKLKKAGKPKTKHGSHKHK